MAFNQSTITDVSTAISGRELQVSWSSSQPTLPVQVYINQQLAWRGYGASCLIPIPGDEAPLRFDIGNVQPSDLKTNFASSLAPAPTRRVQLSWQGGRFQDPNLVAFDVYGSSAPGGAIDYSTILATISAYPGGITTDGFGSGGFGSGGFGYAAGTYSWTSGALQSGTWSFAVVPVDSAGVQGTAMTIVETVAVPPRAPGLFSGTNTRLQYTLSAYGQTGFGAGGFGMPSASINWNPPAYW